MEATLDRWKYLPNGVLRKPQGRPPRPVRGRPHERGPRPAASGARRSRNPRARPRFPCRPSSCGSSARCLAGQPSGRTTASWIFVATRFGDDGHVLLNLRTGERYSIPREFRPEFFRCLQPDASRVMIILVATLSSAPDADGDRCVGAAIVSCVPFDDRSRRQITFWRMEHQLAMPPSDVMGCEPEDVVYHNRAFHFLTAEEQLYVCRPVLDQNGVLQGVDKGLRVFQPHECRAYDQQPHVRYLVESRGELLMVVKSSPSWTGSEGQRSRMWTFMVFRMTQLQMPDPGRMLYTWDMVPALNGRMLFVGLGCSRSYEVADFPGFQDGIYFLDDMNTYNPGRMNQNEPYTCSDNGKWSRLLPVVGGCFLSSTAASRHIKAHRTILLRFGFSLEMVGRSWKLGKGAQDSL